MTAVVPNYVLTKDARTDLSYGTAEVRLREVYVDVTTTASSNTTDLNTYVKGGINGIKGVLMNTIDGAVNATAPTWSSTTVTWAGHSGSGGTVVKFEVY